MIVRELLASFGLKIDQSSFKKADSFVDSAKEGLRSLAEAFVLYEIASRLHELVDGVIEAAAHVDDMSNKLGVGAQAFQELRFAAKLSDIGVEEFDHSMTILTKTAAEAAQGNEEAAKTFAQFGIKLYDANGNIRTSDLLLNDIADKMQKAKTQTERLGIAVKFFGERQGSKFAIMMKDGAAGIQALREEANQLGGIMDKDLIASAAQADDNFDRLNFAFQGVKNTIVGAMLPSIVRVQETVIKWIKANKDLIQQKLREWTLAVVSAVIRFYKIMVAFGSVLKAVIDLIGGLRNALIALGIIFGVYLLAQIGEAVIALAAFDAAEIATKLLVLGDAIKMGAAFVFLAALIFMLGEEIQAAFDPNKLGLFEAMQGKWSDLTKRLRDDGDQAQGQFKKTGFIIAAAFSRAVDVVDGFFESVFKQFTLIGVIWDDVVFAIENAPTRIMSAWRNLFKWLDPKMQAVGELFEQITGFNGGNPEGADLIRNGFNAVFKGSPTPSLAAQTAGTTNAPTTSVSVSVDASGQTFDESSLAAKIGQHVNEALTTANRQTLEAMTPAGAG